MSSYKQDIKDLNYRARTMNDDILKLKRDMKKAIKNLATKGKPKKCEVCNGTGFITHSSGMYCTVEDCCACNGWGFLWEEDVPQHKKTVRLEVI